MRKSYHLCLFMPSQRDGGTCFIVSLKEIGLFSCPTKSDFLCRPFKNRQNKDLNDKINGSLIKVESMA